MGLGLLSWERLRAYIFGPLLCAVHIGLFISEDNPPISHWGWEACGLAFGLWDMAPLVSNDFEKSRQPERALMMTKAIAITLTLTIGLSAFASDIVVEFTGRSAVDEISKQKAANLLSATFLDKDRRSRCKHVVIVANPSIKPITKGAVVEERWAASGCEQATKYTVTFIPDPMGNGYLASLDSEP